MTGSYDMSIVVWDVENNVQKLKLQVSPVSLIVPSKFAVTFF